MLWTGFSVGALQTLGFVVIVFGIKRRPIPIVSVVTCGHPVPVSGSSLHPWPISSLPRPWQSELAMTPLPAWVVAGTLVAAAAFAIILDFVKVPVFRRLKIT
jgi:H+-transporting ATPase